MYFEINYTFVGINKFMTMYYNWYTLSVLASLIITLIVAIIGWNQRKAPGGKAFVVLMLSICFWVSTSLLIAIVNNPGTKVVWFNIRFFFVGIVSIAFLAMVLQYIGKESWLTKKLLSLVMLIPLLTQIMTWTNSKHHLFVDMLTGKIGFYFWIHMSYSFVLLLFGVALIFQSVLHSHQVFRKQALVMLAGAVVPIITSFIEAYKFFAPDGESFIPVSFAVSGIIFAWALFKYRLFDLVPVARTTLVETMRDGVLVLDNDYNVADLNQSAIDIFKKHFKQSGIGLIGKSFFELTEFNPKITKAVNRDEESRTELSLNVNEELYWFDLNISTITGTNDVQTAKIIIWRDITNYKQAEEEKARLSNNLKTALEDVKILSDLLPICSSCKNIRDDEGYWHQVENYFQQHSDYDFSHSICPDCIKKLYPDFSGDK